MRLISHQMPNGAWHYPGGSRLHSRSAEDYDQIETYRSLGLLVEKQGLDRSHPTIAMAADYLFSRQTAEGDFRGIYGSQYTPNYSAAITELLVKAGYSEDLRIDKSFSWLLANRQSDGGWAIPSRTVGAKLDAILLPGPRLERDPSRPSSFLVTGVVLRAFAAHPCYRASLQAQNAGELLASGLFARDKYPDRGAPSYWLKFSFPFWFTDLLSALDSLSLIGMSAKDHRIVKALDWFRENQDGDGIWHLSLLRMTQERDRDLWITFAVCRVMKRLLAD